MSTISNERVKNAAIKYLTKVKGFEIVDDDFDGCCIVAVDTTEHELALVTYAAAFGEMPCDEFNRELFEIRAARFLAKHDEFVDTPIRADAVSICVVGADGDRALLKHASGISR